MGLSGHIVASLPLAEEGTCVPTGCGLEKEHMDVAVKEILPSLNKPGHGFQNMSKESLSFPGIFEK